METSVRKYINKIKVQGSRYTVHGGKIEGLIQLPVPAHIRKMTVHVGKRHIMVPRGHSMAENDTSWRITLLFLEKIGTPINI